MTKLGWGILIAICAVLGGFVSLIRWGGVAVVTPGAATRSAKLQAPAPGGVPGNPVQAGLASAPAAGAPEVLLAVPVQGVARATIQDSWGDPRENGQRLHHGTDLMAPLGTPITAVAPGTIEKIWVSKAGGNTLYERSADRRWTYYYAHLSGYAAGLHEGQAVNTGQLLGFVGDSGNAGPGNTHLHFGLTSTDPAQHWYQGVDVNPYPSLAGKPSVR